VLSAILAVAAVSKKTVDGRAELGRTDHDGMGCGNHGLVLAGIDLHSLPGMLACCVLRACTSAALSRGRHSANPSASAKHAIASRSEPEPSPGNNLDMSLI